MKPAPSPRTPSAGGRLRSRRSQAGVSFLGIVFWLLVGGFFAMIGLKLFPIYMNQLKVDKAVEEAAKQAKGPEDIAAVRRTMSRIWDVDDIEHLEAKDVVVARDTTAGNRLTLSYDYEVRENFVSNIDIVVHFRKSVPAGPGAGG